MNLKSTKYHSVGSIRTKIDDYMMEFHHQEWERELEAGTLIKTETMKAERAMDYLNTLMEKGFREDEAWEIVSTEIVYKM